MTIYVRSRELWATSWSLSAQWWSPRKFQPGLVKQNKKAAEILTKVSWQGLPGDFHFSTQPNLWTLPNVPQKFIKYSLLTSISSVILSRDLQCVPQSQPSLVCVCISAPISAFFRTDTSVPLPYPARHRLMLRDCAWEGGEAEVGCLLVDSVPPSVLTDAWRLWKGIWRILGRETHGHSGWEKGSRPFPLPWTSVTLWSEPSQSQVLQFLQSHHLGM